jgi:hypothetical protein
VNEHEALLRAGAQWWVCRSADAAIGCWAVGRVYGDGTIERWQQPELQAWEVPKRRAAAAEIAELAAVRDDAAGSDIAA